MKQECSNYFASRTDEEENPIMVDEETSIRYYALEEVFNSFFPDNSLTIAKSKSIEERDSKHINDSSFTYGETVIFLYYYFILLDFQINGIYFRIYKSRI